MTDSKTRQPSKGANYGRANESEPQWSASFGSRTAPGASAGGSQGSEPGASGVITQARDTAAQLRGQARDVVQQKLSRQTSRSAGELGELARALRQVGEKLEGKRTSALVARAADQLERVSGVLQTSDPTELARRAESFARREPLMFLGGAFALGLIGARFLKSSAQRAAEREFEFEPGHELEEPQS